MKLTKEMIYTIKMHILTNLMNVDESIEYIWKLFNEEENRLPFSKEEINKILKEGNSH